MIGMPVSIEFIVQRLFIESGTHYNKNSHIKLIYGIVLAGLADISYKEGLP